jgi:hypothetical protein
MTQLSIFKHMELVLGRQIDKRLRLGRIAFYEVDADREMQRHITPDRILDFRLSVGARVRTSDSPRAIQDAERDIIKLFSREMMGDLTDELIKLDEWLLEQGIGEDVRIRVRRLIQMTRGENTFDIPEMETEQ